MRPFISMICLLYLITGDLFGYAQTANKVDETFVPERYATAWVEQDATYREILNKIETNKELTELRVNDVRLYIPKEHNVTMPNGNKYVQAYLINSTKDSITVNRADATISGVRTEIKVGKEWKLFQINAGSSCGNSYFKRKLAPGYYLSLKVEDLTSGDIEVAYRVTVYINKQPITSNEAMIHITPELLALAGKPIRSVSF